MRLALYSDIHLELMRDRPWEPPQLDADVIILAGDIASYTHGITWARTAFPGKHIIYVPGNHEFYLGSLADISAMRSTAKKCHVDFLENDSVVIGDVRFVGAILWSDFMLNSDKGSQADYMKIAKEKINDYSVIYDLGNRILHPKETLKLHSESVAYLDEELSKPFDGMTVVVTHFAPHRHCVAPQHQGTDLSPYFVTDLEWLMKKHRIDVWCHGHTHTNNDFVTETGCRVISNQRGYEYELRAGRMDFHTDGVFLDTSAAC